MFQGTVSWAFFHVSSGFVSVLGAGQREDTQSEEGTLAPLGTHPTHTQDTQSEEGTQVPAALSLWGHSAFSRKPRSGSSI